MPAGVRAELTLTVAPVAQHFSRVPQCMSTESGASGQQMHPMGASCAAAVHAFRSKFSSWAPVAGSNFMSRAQVVRPLRSEWYLPLRMPA